MGISTKYLCHGDYYRDLNNFYVMEITVRISIKNKNVMEVTTGISTKEFMSWRLLWGSQQNNICHGDYYRDLNKIFFSHRDYGGDLNKK